MNPESSDRPDPGHADATPAGGCEVSSAMRDLFEEVVDLPAPQRHARLVEALERGVPADLVARVERLVLCDEEMRTTEVGHTEEGHAGHRGDLRDARRSRMRRPRPMALTVGAAIGLASIWIASTGLRDSASEPEPIYDDEIVLPPQDRRASSGLPTMWAPEAGGDGHWFQFIGFASDEPMEHASVERRASRLRGSLATAGGAARDEFLRSLLPDGARAALVAAPHTRIGDGEPCGFIVEWSADCDSDGEIDFAAIRAGRVADSNANGIPDRCE
jgi:hypothetical protein